ncbi:MAG: hypothetical protein LBJ59_00795 [Zoogloeaceae bacterium]|jgi:hypothetical protein|nr:hypothetical protein [Zoogloeaceae bacterium]
MVAPMAAADFFEDIRKMAAKLDELRKEEVAEAAASESGDRESGIRGQIRQGGPRAAPVSVCGVDGRLGLGGFFHPRRGNARIALSPLAGESWREGAAVPFTRRWSWRNNRSFSHKVLPVFRRIPRKGILLEASTFPTAIACDFQWQTHSCDGSGLAEN